MTNPWPGERAPAPRQPDTPRRGITGGGGLAFFTFRVPCMPLGRRHRTGKTTTLTAHNMEPESPQVAEAPTTAPLWRGPAAQSPGPPSKQCWRQAILQRNTPGRIFSICLYLFVCFLPYRRDARRELPCTLGMRMWAVGPSSCTQFLGFFFSYCNPQSMKTANTATPLLPKTRD